MPSANKWIIRVGKLFSMMTRPIRNFNVEQRARKVISQEKPTPAPQYTSTIKQIKLVDDIDPGFKEKQKKKDPKLDTYLKDIYVTSNDPVPDLTSKSNPTKCLPTSRKTFEFEDFNYYHVQNVGEGRCSLQQLQTFLTNHMDNPEKYDASNISDEYKLDKKAVENILEYYKVFRIVSTKEIEQFQNSREVKEIEFGDPKPKDL